MKKAVKNKAVMIASNDTVMIQLKKLFLSEFNVRQVPASKEDDKFLKASIKAQGIKQNLVVVTKGSKHGVIAGGRRYKQLEALLSEGVITGDYLVPCMIEKEKNISAISLSENIKASMHPADEFAAFQSMINEGKTIADISNEFGVSQAMVKKRLKMAAVSSDLLDLYRTGKLNLDHIMAFTVSDDHERQMACYKHVSTGFINTSSIKNFLLDTALLTSNGMVKLVTLKAYKKAGGTIIADLFESDTYINNRDLMESMALDILNKKAETYSKKWKWVDVSLSDYNDFEVELTAKFKDVPDKLTKELKSKELLLEELNEKDYSDWTDEDDALDDTYSSELIALENKREQYRNFSDEQKAVSGVVVGFDNNGEIVVNFGYVKKEDMKLAFPPVNESSSDSVDETISNNTQQAVESNALKNDLGHYKLQALQSELMTDDKLTYDLMVFTLASTVIGEDFPYDLSLDLSINPYNFNSTPDINETGPSKKIDEYISSMEMAWNSHDATGDRFNAFRELTSLQKKRILSYCTAVSYRSNTSQSLERVISNSVDFNIRQHWQPSKENYFSRIKKEELLKIGANAIDEQWADDNAKLPKGQIVDKLDCADAMADWMPDYMK